MTNGSLVSYICTTKTRKSVLDLVMKYLFLDRIPTYWLRIYVVVDFALVSKIKRSRISTKLQSAANKRGSRDCGASPSRAEMCMMGTHLSPEFSMIFVRSFQRIAFSPGNEIQIYSQGIYHNATLTRKSSLL